MEEYSSFPDPVTEVAQSVFDIPYPFPWQRIVISGVLDAFIPHHSEPLRRIVVLPTGAGKSLCWMLPAVMIERITVAVFPLLALMSDQQRRLKEKGISSVTLRGGQNQAQRQKIWDDLDSGKVRIVLANPEVLQIQNVAKELHSRNVGFLVVDETHTVSQWGESFRPACADIGRLVSEWNPPAVLALTATAGPHIRERITKLLFNGEPPTEALADPDRPAIRYGVLPSLSRNHTLKRLIRMEKRPAIVFGRTRSSVQAAARLLRHHLNDTEIRFYHAGLSTNEKRRLEKWFLESTDGVLCATCAYGMGVDKSNIRTVIHLAAPESVEAYLQESGRAARDSGRAHAWLICTPEEIKHADTWDFQKPPRQKSMQLYMSSNVQCRRKVLLEAVGIEAEDCAGCDVCSGEVWHHPPEENIILQIIRWNRGRFRKGELARIIIGRRNANIRRMGLESTKGFGALGGWDLEDAEEALEMLIKRKLIRYGKWRSRKIFPCSTKQ